MFLAELLQIHLLTVEKVVPFADPPGIGGGLLQRFGGEDGAAVLKDRVIHQRGVGGGVTLCPLHIVAPPTVRHRLTGNEPVGGEHGLAE